MAPLRAQVRPQDSIRLIFVCSSRWASMLSMRFLTHLSVNFSRAILRTSCHAASGPSPCWSCRKRPQRASSLMKSASLDAVARFCASGGSCSRAWCDLTQRPPRFVQDGARHRQSSCSASIAFSRAEWMWQIATAMASAASSGSGTKSRSRSSFTSCWT